MALFKDMLSEHFNTLSDCQRPMAFCARRHCNALCSEGPSRRGLHTELYSHGTDGKPSRLRWSGTSEENPQGRRCEIDLPRRSSGRY